MIEGGGSYNGRAKMGEAAGERMEFAVETDRQTDRQTGTTLLPAARVKSEQNTRNRRPESKRGMRFARRRTTKDNNNNNAIIMRESTTTRTAIAKDGRCGGGAGDVPTTAQLRRKKYRVSSGRVQALI